MSDLWTGLQPSLLIVSLSGLFALAGLCLSGVAIIHFKRFPIHLQIGVAYFVGLALFLVVYRFGTIVFGQANMGAKVAVAVCLVLALVQLLTWYNQGYFKLTFLQQFWHHHYRTILYSVLFAVGVIVLLLALWLPNEPVPYIQPYLHYGSVHSGRNVNIGAYIYTHNYIPVLTQNYSQGLLVSVVLWFGFNTGFSALWIWLAVSMCYLAALLYGALRWFGVSRKFSLLGLAIVLAGNTALSLTNVIVIDSFSPIIKNGYSDKVIAIGLFFTFLLWLNCIYKANIVEQKLSTRLLQSSLLSLLFGLVWPICSPESLILAFGVGVSLLLLKWFRQPIAWLTWLLAFATLGLAGATAIQSGGMLTSQSLQDVMTIDGVMDTPPLTRDQVQLVPELPYSHLIDGTGFNYEAAPAEYHIAVPLDQLTQNHFQVGDVWKLEMNLWVALRIMFWPLLGLIVLRRTGKSDQLRHLHIITALALALGFTITFWFQLGTPDLKWALTRFIAPAYLLGMFALVVAGYSWLQQRPQLRWWYGLATGLILVGPLFNIVAIVRQDAITMDTAPRLNSFFHS